MTPKELLAAAERITDSLRPDFEGGEFYANQRLHDENALAEHILATVREDDDDPVNMEFVASLGFWWDDFEGAWSPTEESPLGFYDCGDAWICSDLPSEMYIKTRGQFRSLCKGLGVDLKETKNG